MGTRLLKSLHSVLVSSDNNIQVALLTWGGFIMKTHSSIWVCISLTLRSSHKHEPGEILLHGAGSLQNSCAPIT